MRCPCGQPGRPRDVVDPVTHHLVARGALCNPCFDRAIAAGARVRREHDRRAAARMGPATRVVVGLASALASLTAVGCALAGRPWPGVACVVVGLWFAFRMWRDDVRGPR